MIRQAFVMIVALTAMGAEARAQFGENWPEPKDPTAFRELAETSAAKYVSTGMDTHLRADPAYTPTGDYLNYGLRVSHSPGKTVRLDDQGLPMILVGSEWYYSPGTLGNFSLAAYGRLIAGRGGQDHFLAAVEKLMTMQAENGSLPTPFPFNHHVQRIEPGWTSAMDQGLALSAWTRAYHLTKDARYLEAGNRALDYMLTPFPNGPLGTLEDLDESLKDRTFLLEFMVSPHAVTLNGNMFALLGLYDWWQVTGSERAGKAFEDGADTLAKLLPYYDIGGFSSYDLSHYTAGSAAPHIGIAYHGLHIAQLTALAHITERQVFADYANNFREDVGLGRN